MTFPLGDPGAIPDCQGRGHPNSREIRGLFSHDFLISEFLSSSDPRFNEVESNSAQSDAG